MILRRIARYLVAGSTTTLLMLSLVYIFTSFLSLHYLVATSTAFVITLIAGYFIHKYWTFEDKDSTHARQFTNHTFLVALNFCLNALFMYIFVEVFHIVPLVSQVLTSGILACISFFIYSKIIFVTDTK